MTPLPFAFGDSLTIIIGYGETPVNVGRTLAHECPCAYKKGKALSTAKKWDVDTQDFNVLNTKVDGKHGVRD